RSPAMLMQSLNEALLERKVDAQYAALLVILWEPRERLLTICNAGATPPLIVRGGEILKPDAEGIPIGLLEDRQYDETTFQAQPGDTILLFSDGVDDQLNAKEEEYSRGRVSKLLKKQSERAPKEVADAIFADLDKFRDDTPITDDQTALV